MSIIEKTLPYELLFRFSEDGSLKGAHYQELNCIVKDGVTIQAQPGDAQPVAVAGKAKGLDLQAILGTLALAQAARIDTLEAEAKATTRELAASQANTQALLARIAELEAG